MIQREAQDEQRASGLRGSIWWLEKQGDGERYDVLLGAEPSCDCKGFLRWNRCKHADGLAALKRAGRV